MAEEWTLGTGGPFNDVGSEPGHAAGLDIEDGFLRTKVGVNCTNYCS